MHARPTNEEAMPERRYDDEEVALILHRAADAGATDSDGASARGLTLGDLKEIAAEAGIEPTRIEEAARSVALHRTRSPARSAMGFPPTVQLERVVPVRLEPEELPQLLDLIRNELARQGIVQEVLGGFEWRARSVMGGRYVSIRSEGDATRIRVLGNYRDGLLTFAFGPGPMLAIGGAMLAAGLGAPTPLAIVPAALLGWASTLLPWRHLFGRESRSLHRLLGAIEQRLKELS